MSAERYFYAIKRKSGSYWREDWGLPRGGGWTKDLQKATLKEDPRDWEPQKGDTVVRIKAMFILEEEG